MRETAFAYAKTGAQISHAEKRFFWRLIPKSEISSLSPNKCVTWLETLKTDFLMMRLISKLLTVYGVPAQLDCLSG